jgi:carbon-monoxide dehydrogenase large subunit
LDTHAEETWSLDTEGGFKGVGEGGVIGAVPALVNAIQDALAGFDVLVGRLPLRPDFICGLIAASGKAKAE